MSAELIPPMFYWQPGKPIRPPLRLPVARPYRKRDITSWRNRRREYLQATGRQETCTRFDEAGGAA